MADRDRTRVPQSFGRPCRADHRRPARSGVARLFCKACEELLTMPFEFVQPQFAWALGGLAIPIVIHLMFRRRSRKVDLGTLRFLRLVLTENARRRKLKRWLLLALRMACIGLLAGLFARPYLMARDAAGKQRLVAILIDRSASMELKERGKRLIDLAVEQALGVIGKYGEKTQVEVAFFDQA